MKLLVLTSLTVKVIMLTVALSVSIGLLPMAMASMFGFSALPVLTFLVGVFGLFSAQLVLEQHNFNNEV